MMKRMLAWMTALCQPDDASVSAEKTPQAIDARARDGYNGADK